MNFSTVATGISRALAYKARRALGRPARSLEAVASRSWEIAPGIDEPAAPPYLPVHHAARILGGSAEIPDVESILADLRSSRHRPRPTRAFLLHDAFLLGRNLYCGLHKTDLYSTLDLRPLIDGDTATLKDGVLASTYSGARWFGHFLHDELPLELLAQDFGHPIGHLRRIYSHEPGWRSALGLPAPRRYAAASVTDLIVIDDVGQNHSRRSRYRKLRSRLQGLSIGHDRVLLVRNPIGGGDRRQIDNADEVQTRLEQEGFAIVDTGTSSIEEILRRCNGASVVVSVDGSHAAPALYLAKTGACLLYLYPPRRVSTIMPALANFFGLFGAMFVGEPCAGTDDVFQVDVDELLREIEVAAGQATTVAASGTRAHLAG